MRARSDRYDLVVLGGGTAGLVSSMIAAGAGARVALIERERTGGDCLWTGCVPSKSLIAAAGLAHSMRHANVVGLEPVEPRIDFERVMEHVSRAIATIAPHDSPERLRAAGVEVIEAHGRFAGPGRIEAGRRTLRWRTAIVATGSRPVVPPLDGLAQAGALTTDTVWNLRELPERLVVLGGGPVGCELAQAFARLGSRVTLVELAERLLAGEDPRTSALIAERLRGEGIDLRLGARGTAVRRGELLLDGGASAAFDRILVAAGRAPRTDDLGLDSVGVRVDERGYVVADDRLRTSGPGIFAAGDVTGRPAFTHVAGHHARIATSNALFHTRSRVAATIPRVTFTDPEVARVGLSEAQARERWGDGAQISQFDYARSDRAITAGRAYGFAKLVADPRGRLVGATVAAPGGGEAIAELTVWVSQHAKIELVSRTVHAYPTIAEGPARAADEHVAARYASARMRAAARLLLAILRAVEGPR